MKIITCENIRFSYIKEDKEEFVVFEHLDFTVTKGEFVSILGHNGSGKSTLAKHFNAILLPNEGTVTVAGMDTQQEEDTFEIRKQVGMVFQNPDNQIVATVVEEDVAFGLENMGVPPQEIRERVDAALQTVGMYEFRRHAPHQLSGGQKQRVAIAGILAMQPDCIVLDEPTAMLDPKGRKEVMKTLRELVTVHGITVVLITHYMDEAAQTGRVVVMDKGKIVYNDTPQHVFAHVKELQAMNLDVPTESELLYHLQQAGVPVATIAIDRPTTVAHIGALLDQAGVQCHGGH